MKKLGLVIIAFIIVCNAFAQNIVATQEQIKDFLKTTTLVVTDENPLLEYNFKIKDAVEQNWKITNYDFISQAEYEEKRMDPKYSFLIMEEVFFEKDKTQARYRFLSLTLGGKYRKESDMPQLCNVPLSYLLAEEETYVYKIPAIVKFIQNHVLLTSENPDLNTSNIISNYHKNISDISDKTLYLVNDELGKQVNTEAKIKKLYPYDFKIVTREEVEEAINNQDEKVVFLHKVGPTYKSKKARCWKVIMGAKDARLYYFDYHMVNEKNPDGLLESDFKKLAK